MPLLGFLSISAPACSRQHGMVTIR
ncbi:hypothetical protein MICRO8M_30013 [Microbacterium sp. 8M]|nr:hypothetical protein MICRO8M_30013 [Microbacterium sp. 8M]